MNVIILVKTQHPYWHGQSRDRCPSLPAVLCHIRLDEDLDVGDLGAKECVHVKKKKRILVNSCTCCCSCWQIVEKNSAHVENELFIRNL